MTSQWAMMSMAGILAKTMTNLLKDSAGATHTVSAGFTASTPYINAGTGSTTCYVDDCVLTSQQSNSPAGTGAIAATVSAYTGGASATSGSFTVTGTITNGTAGNITYKEIGVYVYIAALSAWFLISHDLINGTTGYVVSASGTMACTLTVTNS
jgi:hypothetical protein